MRSPGNTSPSFIVSGQSLSAQRGVAARYPVTTLYLSKGGRRWLRFARKVDGN